MQPKIEVAVNGNELIIREGKAAELFPPRKVELSGNIEAPGEYFTKRKNEIEPLLQKTNVVFDEEGLSILLTVNENDHHAITVSGKLEFFKEFLEFGINRNKKYTVDSLYKMLQLKRAYFKNREDHATMLDQLKKFQAKTEIEFASTNDFKGSVAFKKIEVCKTNLTYIFTLQLPIYKGMNQYAFPVEIYFEPNDGSIICWLVSEDLAELEIKIRDEVMAEQKKIFENVVLIKK